MAAEEFPHELAGLLAGIQRLVRRRLRRGLAVPLRGAEVELLRLVTANPGIRVSAAAKELCLAGNSVSTLVNRLVTSGYLQREADPEDRRAALLLPTPEATERLAAWAAERDELITGQVALLPPDERAALAAALPALRRLAAGLQQQEREEGNG